MPNITLNLTGSSSNQTISDELGNYQFSSLVAGGDYTVTPMHFAMAAGSTGINTIDVVATQRHFLGIVPFPAGCQQAAADVNGDSMVTTIDVIGIQRFALGLTAGLANTGQYLFDPPNRVYFSLVTSQTEENYDACVFGDVVSPFVEP
jgi:hypothetical protein